MLNAADVAGSHLSAYKLDTVNAIDIKTFKKAASGLPVTYHEALNIFPTRFKI